MAIQPWGKVTYDGDDTVDHDDFNSIGNSFRQIGYGLSAGSVTVDGNQNHIANLGSVTANSFVTGGHNLRGSDNGSSFRNIINFNRASDGATQHVIYSQPALNNKLTIHPGYGAGASTELQIAGSLLVAAVKVAGAFVLTGSAFKYLECESPHVAWYRKADASYSFYWRRSDTGYSGGPNETELMRLDNAGSLFVTSSIVSGSGVSATTLTVKDSSGFTYTMTRNTSDGFCFITGNQETFSGYRFFTTLSGAKERFTILNNGNVGVNAASPQATLDVGGGGSIFLTNGPVKAKWFHDSTTATTFFTSEGASGLGFYTNSLARLQLTSSGRMIHTPIDTFANNAAAISGGLTAGTFYMVSGSNPRQIAVVF